MFAGCTKELSDESLSGFWSSGKTVIEIHTNGTGYCNYFKDDKNITIDGRVTVRDDEVKFSKGIKSKKFTIDQPPVTESCDSADYTYMILSGETFYMNYGIPCIEL